MNVLKTIDFNELYHNCIYSSIAHAIFVLKEPFFAYTQSWDEYNYSFNYGTTRGTISFYNGSKVAVGAARDEQSSRRSLYPQYDAISLFKEASDFIKDMASKDALEYLYDEVEDVTKPIASIGFWVENNELFSSDDMAQLLANGGEYVQIISQKQEELVLYWKEQYSLNQEEIELTSFLFNSWRNKTSIKHKDVKHIINKKCCGYKECIDSLNEIGILLI